MCWVNAQYGDCRAELDCIRAEHGIPIHHWPDLNPLHDVDGFAAFLAALDLVISIDNSTAHLAGALGTETWMLLPFASETGWRWLTQRTDTLWYAGVRLWRQPRPGQWSPVVEAAARELAGRVSRQPDAIDDDAAADF